MKAENAPAPPKRRETTCFLVLDVRGTLSAHVEHARKAHPAFIHSSYFGCQTTKRAGLPWLPNREAGPLLKSLLIF